MKDEKDEKIKYLQELVNEKNRALALAMTFMYMLGLPEESETMKAIKEYYYKI